MTVCRDIPIPVLPPSLLFALSPPDADAAEEEDACRRLTLLLATGDTIVFWKATPQEICTSAQKRRKYVTLNIGGHDHSTVEELM